MLVSVCFFPPLEGEILQHQVKEINKTSIKCLMPFHKITLLNKMVDNFFLKVKSLLKAFVVKM